MTRSRSAVLAALEASAEPLAAQDLAARLERPCDQATVYRSLHFLEKEGLVDSFVLSCEAHGVERYYAPRARAHRHWFHCESCHRFTDLGECTLHDLIGRIEAERGCRVAAHTFYLTGLCPSCAGGGPA